MYAVRCPNCQRTLRLDRPVRDARLRCRHCGHIFAGTSVEVAERARREAPRPENPLQTPPPPLTPPPGPGDPFPSLGPAPTAPPQRAPMPGGPAAAGYPPPGAPGEPMPARPIRKRPSVIPLIIVCVGFVGIIALAFGAHWLATHKHRTIEDGRGNVVRSGYWTEEEYERHKKEVDEQIRGKAGVDTPGAGSVPPPGPRDPGATIPPDRPIPREPVRPPGPAATVVDPRDMIAGDPKLIPTAHGQPVTRDETPTSGWFVGTVENRYNIPIQAARIAVYTYDVNDQRRPPWDGMCYYLPPGGTVRFSVKYRGLRKGHIYDIKARVYAPVVAPANVVSWAIPMDQTSRDNQGRNVVITGKVRNPFDFPVRNLKVHYDVYDPEGVQINQTTKLAGAAPDSLPAGGEADFTITFNPGVTGYSIRMVRTWVVRVWAAK